MIEFGPEKRIRVILGRLQIFRGFPGKITDYDLGVLESKTWSLVAELSEKDPISEELIKKVINAFRELDRDSQRIELMNILYKKRIENKQRVKDLENMYI